MSTDKQTSSQSVKGLKCVHCYRQLKTLKKVFPLGNLPIHYHCLIKEIEKNKYPIYSFTIQFQLYIEDKQPHREAYLVKDKLYSNKNTYLEFSRKHSLIKLLYTGLFQNKILGGQLIVPYGFAKQTYLLAKEKHFLIYYVASKIRLLSPGNVLNFFSDDTIIKAILDINNSPPRYPIIFGFPKEPPDTIRWWLKGFCKQDSKLSYRTDNYYLSNFLSFDKEIAIRTSDLEVLEDNLRENVLKYLKGEKVETYDFSDGSLRKAFQDKGMKKHGIVIEKKTEDKNKKEE